MHEMMRSNNAALRTGVVGAIGLAISLATLLAVPRLALAYAAEASAPMLTSKPAGVCAGAILAALLCYALWLLARPLARARDRDLKRVLLLLAVLLALKALALSLFNGYSVDLGTYEAWALKISLVGPAQTYQEGYFLDYPPGYLYTLWAAGALAKALGVEGALRSKSSSRCRR